MSGYNTRKRRKCNISKHSDPTANNVNKLFEQLTECMSEEKSKLLAEQEEWEQHKKLMKKCEFGEVINMNVGGILFTTTLDTLTTEIPLTTYDEKEDKVNKTMTGGHMLAAMFSGNFNLVRDDQDRVFIDRDGTHFRHILNFLRSGGDCVKTCTALDDKRIRHEVREEAEFYGLEDLVQFIDGTNFESRIIAHQDINLKKTLTGWLREDCKNARIGELLYRGSRDGFTAATFHSKCDNRGPTMTIVRSTNDCIFGGFADVSWNTSGELIPSNRSWLYLLKRSGKQPQKLKLTGNSNEHALYGDLSDGPMFGENDLLIPNNCNTSNCSCHLGDTYEHGGDNYLFTGGPRFLVQEIEVFSVANYE